MQSLISIKPNAEQKPAYNRELPAQRNDKGDNGNREEREDEENCGGGGAEAVGGEGGGECWVLVHRKHRGL